MPPKSPAPIPESTPASDYRVLARKYRPATFSEVVGQTSVVRQLQGDIRENRIGHAYLFTGPRGVGKTSMARIFAKAVNCVTGPTPTPCLKCAHCIGITSDADLDVVEVDAATYTKKDETVELLEGIDRVSFSARYKVYIIDEVHMFSTHSFNVLLKRLEEPPPGVIFVLATTNPEKLPETVISRCRRLEFDRMEVTEIVDRLREISDREAVKFRADERERVLEAIALASEGGMRDAQVALDQMISLSEGEITLETARQLIGIVEGELLQELLEGIMARETAKCLLLVGQLVDKGRDLQKFIKTFTAYLRDAMLLKAGASEELLKVSRADSARLRACIAGLSMPALLNCVQQFLELEERMRGAAPPRFLLEFTLIKLTAIHPKFVLDAIDAGQLGKGSESSKPSASAAPAPRTTLHAPVLSIQAEQPVKPREDAPRMLAQPVAAGQPMLMRKSTSAAVELAEVAVDDEPPRTSDPEAAIKAFKEQADAHLPNYLRIIKQADVALAEDGALVVTLRAGDGVMRGHLEKAEKLRDLQAIAAKVFGRTVTVRIAVAGRSATVVPVESFYPPAMESGPADGPVSEEESPFAGEDSGSEPQRSPVSRKLTLDQALAQFPDFREAIDLVRKHCGAVPVLFNGQRI